MLPFLQPKKMSSVIIARTKPEGGVEPVGEENEEMDGLQVAAEDMLSAIHAKDASKLASALRAAHDLCQDEMGPSEDMGA